jgi:predicted MFS family arabinose efflux permease
MPSHVFFGWKVVWVAFLVAVFGWGIGFYGPPVLLQTLHEAHGWPISTISAAITLHFLFSALMVANLPEIHRHFGLGRVTSAGAVLTGLGIIAWANTQHIWQMFPAALLTGAGYAAMSAAAINAMVSRWFERDRPKALSLALNGASVGGVIFAPLLVYLIATLGLEIATLAIATSMLALTWPLAIQFLGPAPEDLGLTPDGCIEGALTSRPPKATLTRGQLLRDRRFVTMSAPFALGLFAQVGLFTHLIVWLSPVFGASGAAAALSLTAVCAVIGRTLLGWFIGDRDRRLAASASFLIQATGVILLTFGGGLITLLLGCILFGLGVGNLISLPPLIAQNEFERGDVGPVFALVTAINQTVFALAPAFFGQLRDATASYVLPFTIAAAAYLMSALIVALGRVRSPRRHVAH